MIHLDNGCLTKAMRTFKHLNHGFNYIYLNKYIIIYLFKYCMDPLLTGLEASPSTHSVPLLILAIGKAFSVELLSDC